MLATYTRMGYPLQTLPVWMLAGGTCADKARAQTLRAQQPAPAYRAELLCELLLQLLHHGGIAEDDVKHLGILELLGQHVLEQLRLALHHGDQAPGHACIASRDWLLLWFGGGGLRKIDKPVLGRN